MKKVLPLLHQNLFLHAPWLHPELRFHFLVGGYGCGKSRCLALLWLKTVFMLNGKKDKAGDGPRILLGGVNLGHLAKTVLVYIFQYLDDSGTPYRYDKKDNRIFVGNTTTILVSLSDPKHIQGYDVTAALCLSRNTKVIVLRNNKIRRIKICKINKETDKVLTDAGWRNIKSVRPTCKEAGMNFLGIRCTHGHRFPVSSTCEGLDTNSKRADTIVDDDYIETLKVSEVRKWEKERQKSLRVRSIESVCQEELKDTTIFTSEENPQSRCTRQCGKMPMVKSQKGWLYTILTVIKKTMSLKILPASQGRSIASYIQTSGSKTQKSSSGLKSNSERPPRTSIMRNTSASVRYAETSSRAEERSRITAHTNVLVRHITRGQEKKNTQDSVCSELTPQYMSVGSVKKSLRFRLIAALDFVRGLVPIERGIEEMWNLTVDDDIHKYFLCQSHSLAMRSDNCDELDDLNAADPDAATFEALRSVNERLRQQILGARPPMYCVLSTAQGQRGLYRIYTTFKKSGVGFTLVRGRTRDNPYLDKSYVESQYKYLSAKEVESLLEGKFVALASGRVFSDFDWERNYQPVDMDMEVAAGEVVFVAMDYNIGHNKATAFILRQGTVYGIKRYDFANPADSPMVWKHDFPHNDLVFIPDATATKEVMMYFKELRKYGIRWVTRSKNLNVEDSVFSVNSLLRSGRLIFTRAAQETAEACAGFMRDKNNQIPSGKAPSDYAHDVDSVRYVVGFLLRSQVSLLDVYRATLMRKDNMEKDTVPSVEEFPGGYTMINTGAV